MGVMTGQIYRSDLAGLKSYRISPSTVRLVQKLLGPLLGSVRGPRRTTRALPERDIPSIEEVITTARPAPENSGASRNPPANGQGGAGSTSVMREWVNELTGRSENSASAVRAPTDAEISQLVSMFPDLDREVLVAALQRRYVRSCYT